MEKNPSGKIIFKLVDGTKVEVQKSDSLWYTYPTGITSETRSFLAHKAYSRYYFKSGMKGLSAGTNVVEDISSVWHTVCSSLF